MSRKSKTNENDSLNNKAKKEDTQDEEKVYRTMIRLDDFDTIISIFGIECIEKRMRFVEHPNPRWQYGIVINGGIEPNVRYPKTDICAWYERQETRDKRYEYLLELLGEYGIKILRI